MFRLINVVLVAVLPVTLAAPQRPLPIIDMHLHANRADDNGPPPTYLCPGFDSYGQDPGRRSADGPRTKPTCANLLVGATTDDILMKTTLEIFASATFLTPTQKRDILYNNAARFLRLTPEQIAKHHGR